VSKKKPTPKKPAAKRTAPRKAQAGKPGRKKVIKGRPKKLPGEADPPKKGKTGPKPLPPIDVSRVPSFSAVKGRQLAFLRAYCVTGTVTGGARAVNISDRMVRYWRDHCPEFRRAMEEAKRVAIDILESEAWDRALRGTPHYRWSSAGKLLCGPDGQPAVFYEKSNALLTFLLKGHRPEVFARERDVHVTGHVEHEHAFEELNLPTEVLEVLLAAIREHEKKLAEKEHQERLGLPAPQEVIDVEATPVEGPHPEQAPPPT
jgi:hypothetical protein